MNELSPNSDTVSTDAVMLTADALNGLSLMSESGELALFEQLGDAVALCSEDGRRIEAMTSSLARLPGVSIDEVGDDWQALERVLEQAAARVPTCRLNKTSLADGRRLLRVNTDAHDVQQYLAERDSLFLTSRTVSVSEMATALAHELNQPLGTLANLLQGTQLRLQGQGLDPEALAGVVNSALDQTRFAQSVIERIRDFTASRRPDPRTLSLSELVTTSCALLDWLLLTAEVSLVIEHSDVPVFVRGDETMLQQVMINLIRNAVEAMRECTPTDRKITIVTAVDGAVATVQIRDQGPGLSAGADAPFLPFVSSKADGMGVGLNICRSFLELHQGRLWLDSHADGGCAACLELPLVVPEDAAHVTGDTP